MLFRSAAAPVDQELCSGPAKLCEALGIDRQFDRHDLRLGQKIWLAESQSVSSEAVPIRVTQRIGVTSAEELPLRFVWAAHPAASGPKSWR